MPVITLEQINNHKIKPVKIKTDPRPIKGSDIFPELYGNMFMLAPTNTGKTTVIANIIPKIIGKKTKVIIFASTAHSDPVWLAIRRALERKGNEVTAYTSIRDHEGNHLQNLVADLIEEAKQREEEEKLNQDEAPKATTEDILQALHQDNGITNYMDKYDSELDEDKPKKEKYQTPEYLLIFDDMSKELRSPEITYLLKENRHHLLRIIVSSQGLKDLMPVSRLMINGWIIFKGYSMDTMDELHKSIGLKLPFNVFYDLYRASTKATADNPKNFFYFQVRHNDFRRNLNQQWRIPESVFDLV